MKFKAVALLSKQVKVSRREIGPHPAPFWRPGVASAVSAGQNDKGEVCDFSVQDGAQEAAATSCGAGRHPAEQHPDLPQSFLPQRHRGGMSGRLRPASPAPAPASPAAAQRKPVHPPLSLSVVCHVQKFEVATGTRIRDLSRTIAHKLSLSSVDGYSIFVKTYDKVHQTFSGLTAGLCSVVTAVSRVNARFARVSFSASQLERRRVLLRQLEANQRLVPEKQEGQRG